MDKLNDITIHPAICKEKLRVLFYILFGKTQTQNVYNPGLKVADLEDTEAVQL